MELKEIPNLLYDLLAGFFNFLLASLQQLQHGLALFLQFILTNWVTSLLIIIGILWWIDRTYFPNH